MTDFSLRMLCWQLLLKMPLAQSLLTHARRTGYDRMGHTVPHKLSCGRGKCGESPKESPRRSRRIGAGIAHLRVFVNPQAADHLSRQGTMDEHTLGLMRTPDQTTKKVVLAR